jgi:SAM-dependent methyltransferase
VEIRLARVPPAVVTKIRCPRCVHLLHASPPDLACSACATVYPVCEGIPILIDAEKSVFSPAGIMADFQRSRTASKSRVARLMFAIASRAPHITSYRRHEELARSFAQLLAARTAAPAILVVGSGTEGFGMQAFRDLPAAVVCECDVYLTESRMLVADLLHLPFETESFDAVVAQGVLEHVIDPHRAAEEIHRVLRPGGLVCATTPFVMGVHMPVADYTRFSRLGLIRLFRRFSPLRCDVIEGPAVALAYSLVYFAMALCSARGSIAGAKIAKYVANFFIFWLRYVDELLQRSPVSIDAASSYGYIGQKSDVALSDLEVVGMFKGVGLCPW